MFITSQKPYRMYGSLIENDPCLAFFGSTVSSVGLMKYTLCEEGVQLQVFQHKHARHRLAIDDHGFKFVFSASQSLKRLLRSAQYELLCKCFSRSHIRVARFLRSAQRSDFRSKFVRADRRTRIKRFADILKRGLVIHALHSCTSSSEAISLFIPATLMPRMFSLSDDPWIRLLPRYRGVECHWFNVPVDSIWIVPDTFEMEGEVLVFLEDIWPYRDRLT